MSTAGRLNKYDRYIQPNLELITGWLRSGYTQESIAKRLGVGKSTWEHYKVERSELRELIVKGQQDVAPLCVNNLVKRANGYSYDEKTVEEVKERNEAGELVIVKVTTKIVTKQVVADVASNIFLLCNRDKNWQNTQHIQHSGELLNTLSDDDCQKIRNLLRANHEQATNGNGNPNPQPEPQ